MDILGSSFSAVMKALGARLAPGDRLLPFDPKRPLVEQLATVDVLIKGSARVQREDFERAPRLKLIHQHGVGVDGIDLDEARLRGVAVATVPGANHEAVAEHALALILALARGLHRAPGALARSAMGEPLGLDLSGATLGIVGLGASGTQLSSRARALGLRVLGLRREAQPQPPQGVEWVGGATDLPALLKQADVVSLHVPRNAQTEGLIGAAEFALMKPSAFLVNVARAQLVDRQALLAALQEGRLAGAAFDVHYKHPLDMSDPLYRCEGFLATPHVAGFTGRSVERLCTAIVDNIARLKAGQPLRNTV